MAPVHSAAAEAPSADDDVLRSVASLREKIWDAGFRPVAVYTVAAGLRLRHKQPGKRPFGNDWPTAARRNPPAAVTDPPQPDTTNTGILCDGLRCIDIDIDDLMVASGCAEIARKMFGAAPARYRNNSPRRLLLYRAAVGEPPKRVVVGTFGKVEILGRGQQFVAFGDHESGAELQWEGDAPGTVSRDSIPAVEENQITGFLEAVSAIIGSESPSQKPGGKKSGKKRGADLSELLRRIVTGEDFHNSTNSVAGYFAARIVPVEAAVAVVHAAFDAVPETQRDPRWQERRDDAERCIRAIYRREAEKRAGDGLPRGFSLNDDGLWYQPPPRRGGTEPAPVWVCGPLHVIAETCDDTWNSHGLLLRWIDRTGHEHTWPMPRRMVHADGNAIAAELEDAGLSCGASREQHEFLKQFLGAVRSERRVRCVDQAGWHGVVYVQPNGRTFGAAAADDIVLQTERAAAGSAYAERGTLSEWRDNIARQAVGNDLLLLTISTAFAAPLLDVLGDPSGGVHIRGGSQIGKTTTERSAMSVHGPGDDKHMRTWRATANGLEAVAAENSDGLLILDELAQANAREVDQVVYMIANSAGKARANRAGGARRQRNWRILVLSTGEMSLEAKLSEAGLRIRAGQDVRMVDLPADAGAGMGIFQNLHAFPSAAALAEHLRAAASNYCGTAGPAYLDQLARERDADPAQLVATLGAGRQQFLDAHVPSDADGQVRSVAKRFALIAVAGELATEYGITGWPEGEALRAGGACFRRWLETRGGIGAAEEMQAVEQVRAFVAAHGSSRFELEDSTDQRIISRAGWKLRTDEGWGYLITSSCWRTEVCRGLNTTDAAGALIEAGFLVRSNDGRRTVQRRIAPHGIVRGYLIRGTILEGDDDGK